MKRSIPARRWVRGAEGAPDERREFAAPVVTEESPWVAQAACDQAGAAVGGFSPALRRDLALWGDLATETYISPGIGELLFRGEDERLPRIGGPILVPALALGVCNDTGSGRPNELPR